MNAKRSTWILAVLLIVSGTAAADPIWIVPPPGKAILSGGAQGEGVLALSAEFHGVGVVGSEDQSTYPDLGAIKGGEPEIARGRLGLVGHHGWWPIGGVFRVDLAEAQRLDGDDLAARPLAVLSGYIDDAALWWTPRVWANAWVGRGKVPFSRFRHVDRSILMAGAVPFVVDRVAPDRRWGAAFFGDLGALSFATGAYADTQRLELRAGADDDQLSDPSAKGRAMIAGHAEWTPRAPIGRDHVATAPSDPWFETWRVSAGLGALWRNRQLGGSRLDLSFSGQTKWRRLFAIAELMVARERGAFDFTGGAFQGGVLFIDRAIAFVMADYDHALELWSAGGGVSYFVTSDRRSKVSFVGWLRRDRVGGPRRDGALVQLQAWL